MGKREDLSKLLTFMLIGSFLLICTICCVSILFLYSRLSANHQQELNEAATRSSAELIQAQYDKSCSLVANCSGIEAIQRIPENLEEPSLDTKKTMIYVHDSITALVGGSPVGQYVIKASFFRRDGVMVQYNSLSLNSWVYLNEAQNFWNSEPCRAAEDAGTSMVFGLYPASRSSRQSFFCLYPIYSNRSNQKLGYAVCEYDPAVFVDILAQTDNISYALTDANGNWLYTPGSLSQLEESGQLERIRSGQAGTFQSGGYSYGICDIHIPKCGLTLYGIMRVDNPQQNTILLVAILALILTSCLILTLVTMRICSRNITEPIAQVKRRLKRIAANDYGYDGELTRLPGDFAQIGSEINRMTGCIQQLLDASVEDAKKRKDYEIAALQNQINPHFIYNTLDSIHWMAVLQKNTGICIMTEALTKLLRTLADSPNEKITLREELSLLNSYITIQSLRYMEIFDFVSRVPEELQDFRIVKFTLQPLVENAILHGVEPSGHLCTITLSAENTGAALRIVVQDNGIGMTPEQVEQLNYGAESTLRGHIGARNVRERLRLIYGEPFGLHYESEPETGTRAIVTIPLEE